MSSSSTISMLRRSASSSLRMASNNSSAVSAPAVMLGIAGTATLCSVLLLLEQQQHYNDQADEADIINRRFSAFKPSTTSSEAAAIIPSSLHAIGIPHVTEDLEHVRQVLQKIKGLSKKVLRSNKLETTASYLHDYEKAALVLTGYKGGAVDDQVNQDRALLISPYFLGTDDNDLESSYRILGVFDGHAQNGELVADYCMKQLPKILARKLSKRLGSHMTQGQQQIVVKQCLVDTFLELDRTAPGRDSSGCTASVVLQMGRYLYVANTGDSRSFICVHHSSVNITKVVYLSQAHKPDSILERERIERMGGKVWIPNAPGGAARVIFRDPDTGEQSGLAMSRAIGDRDVAKFGVIPNPTVDVMDLSELVEDRIGEMSNYFHSPTDDVEIFAVSASDGMMDILDPKGIAKYLAPSLYHDAGEHLMAACEQLIATASEGWKEASPDGKYRDDISISVCKLRSPASKEEEDE